MTGGRRRPSAAATGAAAAGHRPTDPWHRHQHEEVPIGATASDTISGRRVAVIEAAIDIECPAEVVLGYCSDHTHEIEWNPAMRRVAKLTDGPIGVGTRYQMQFRPGRPSSASASGSTLPPMGR